MYQTCYRFEKLITNETYEDFYSAFDGNIKDYSINKEFILSYIQTQENKNKNKNISGLKNFGGKLKKGIFSAGKAVKENTVKGINFVKDKVNKNKNNDLNYNNSNRFNSVNDFSHSSDNCANNQKFNNSNNNYNGSKSFNNNQNNNNQFNNFSNSNRHLY